MTSDTDPTANALHENGEGTHAPNRWLQVAPWLREHATDPAFSWTARNPNDANPVERRRYATTIATLAATEHKRVRFGELFPLLPSDVDLLDMPGLSTRATNWARRTAFRSSTSLVELSAQSILDSPQAGKGTAVQIIENLILLCCAELLRPDRNTSPESAVDADLHEAVKGLLSDMQVIVQWNSLRGKPNVSVFTALPEYAPSPVVDAHRRIHELDPTTVINDIGQATVASQIDTRIKCLDPRDQEVLRRRVLAITPSRLEQLGVEFGVSRERVRQFESRAIASLREWAETNEGLHALIAAARAEIGPLSQIDHIRLQLPALFESVDSTDVPLWRVISLFEPGFEIGSQWCAVPSLADARTMSERLIGQLSSKNGVVPVAQLSDALSIVDGKSVQMEPDSLRAWIDSLGHTILSDNIITSTSQIGDYAAAILEIHGQPMTADEIVGRLHVARSARSATNRFYDDERFQRVSRTQWGLTEWGGIEYTNVRSAIGDHLDNHGGSSPLTELVEDLTRRFDVKESSIVTYSAAPPYSTRAGIVTRSTSVREPRKDPTATRSLFRSADGWRLAVTINREHLRGSGSPLPTAIASVIGVNRGDTVHLQSPQGPQGVSWSATQPTLGSIRRFLISPQTPEGCTAFFCFGDDGRFDVDVVADAPSGPTELAAMYCGQAVPASLSDTARLLAQSVGLSNPNPMEDVASAFRRRGDAAVADLVERLFARSVLP